MSDYEDSDESPIGVEEEADQSSGFLDLVPMVAAELARNELGSREKVEGEIDLMLRSMKEVWRMEPDQAMRLLSAISARATQLSVLLHRVEGSKFAAAWKQVRTQQIGQILSEVDRQFKMSSRNVTMRKLDYDLLVK